MNSVWSKMEVLSHFFIGDLLENEDILFGINEESKNSISVILNINEGYV